MSEEVVNTSSRKLNMQSTGTSLFRRAFGSSLWHPMGESGSLKQIPDCNRWRPWNWTEIMILP